MTVKTEEVIDIRNKHLPLTESHFGTIYAEKILKPRHQPLYSAEFPRLKKPSLYEQYANVSDVALKMAPKNSLEGRGNKLILDAEREAQQRARLFPPVTDRAYVESADFTLPDLYNDIVSRMEWTIVCYLIRWSVFGFSAISTYDSVLDWEYYRNERKKWRKCRYKYCLNMFAIKGDNIREQRAKRSDSRFCCGGCRLSADDADLRYEQHGSYLPVYFYVDRLSDSVNDDFQLHESAMTDYRIGKQIEKSKPVRHPNLRKKSSERHGKTVTFKTLEEAKKAYEMAENSGRIRI